jgi:hypothetical protein
VRIAVSGSNARIFELSPSAPPPENARIRGVLHCPSPGGRLVQVGSRIVRTDESGHFASKVLGRGQVVVRAVTRMGEGSDPVVVDLNGSIRYQANLEIYAGE